MWIGWALWMATLAVLSVLAGRHYGLLKKIAQREERDVFGAWPIPSVSLDQVDARFRPNAYGPTLETQVQFIGRGATEVIGGTSDAEAWILAVLAQSAMRMFEFGTCTGKTAYLWAINSPPDARIATLTLPPESAPPGDAESHFTSFIYSGTPAERKITQLFGDSRQFDIRLHDNQYDLIFVDGAHAYEFVVSDTRKALRMVKPGGLILWHDYCGAYCNPGVYRALNELRSELDLRHIRGTTLVCHRRAA